MATNIDALAIRRELNGLPGAGWLTPRAMGPDGWLFMHESGRRHVIVTCADYPPDNADWVHASMTGADNVPTYHELAALHRAVFGDGWAYQVFTPTSEHVNIHDRALHLFGRLDGAPALPDFTRGTGSI
jgi:hypothetical protein